MSLQAPYATCSEPQALYGDVAGSTPSWSKSNLHDGGRAHVSCIAPTELGRTGFKDWDTAAAPQERYGRRVVGQTDATPSARCIAEPSVVGAHHSYYTRRSAAVDDDPAAFRRSVRALPQTERQDRPLGKRYVPQPYAALARPHHTPASSNEDGERTSAPCLPRLGHPTGIVGLREDAGQELLYERSSARSLRQDTLRGSGGSMQFGGTLDARSRSEGNMASLLFSTLKDSPSFMRFSASMAPPPKVSPHERRTVSMRARQQAERSAEEQMVASLQLPDDDD